MPPPPVDWSLLGICEFWMTNRCRKGKNCTFEHPAQNQKSRLYAKWTSDVGQAELAQLKRERDERRHSKVSERDHGNERGVGGGIGKAGPERARASKFDRERDGSQGGGTGQLDLSANDKAGNEDEMEVDEPPVGEAGRERLRSRIAERQGSRDRNGGFMNRERWTKMHEPERKQHLEIYAQSSPKSLPWASDYQRQPDEEPVERKRSLNGCERQERSLDSTVMPPPPPPSQWDMYDHAAQGDVGMLIRGRASLLDRSTLPNNEYIDIQPVQGDRADTTGVHMADWAKESGKVKGAKAEVSGARSEIGPSATSKLAPTATKKPAFFAVPSVLPHKKSKVTSKQETEMGAVKRMSNGEPKQPVGPHPSTIRVSAQYQTQAAIERKLQQVNADAQERSLAEAKEDSLRLQGVQWIDIVRRQLQLPVRTYTTACTYFHKFRLAHPPGTSTGDGYLWNDAAAASLLTACKLEDTLKKSKEILAASYNVKVTAAHEQLPADDPLFEQPSRVVIGLERLVLEAGSFDFRSRDPHSTLTKIAKTLGKGEDVKRVHELAWTSLTDVYRTFAPLKQTSATLALASLELASRLLQEDAVLALIKGFKLAKWHITREETMETILDSLDLYIQHTASSILGVRYSIDEFLRIRLALNKECNDDNIPRHCTAPTPQAATLQVQNGHPTPVSPPQTGAAQQLQQHAVSTPEFAPPVGAGTLRFMLNPQLAKNEREQVENHFKEEWEEYEEEIEVPLPRSERPPAPTGPPTRAQGPPSSRASSRDRRSEGRREERERPRAIDERREQDRQRERDRERDRERQRERDRDRDYDRDRDRHRPRDRDRDSRHHDDDRRRGYDDRDRRYDDRRYGDDRRSRDDRRYRDDRR